MQNHDVESSMPSTSTINNLINAERIPSEQALGLNPQEASILNFLRVDAAEKQRDRRSVNVYYLHYLNNIILILF